MLCKIRGFHGGDYEECRILGCCVALVRTDVSEELVASIIRFARIGELGKALTVTISLMLTLFLARWWRRHVLLERWFSQEQHDVTSQKTAFFRFRLRGLHGVRMCVCSVIPVSVVVLESWVQISVRLSWFSVVAAGKNFHFAISSRLALRPTTSPMPGVPGPLVREADRWPPANVKVKNMVTCDPFPHSSSTRSA
jgi:hypothetical protein